MLQRKLSNVSDKPKSSSKPKRSTSFGRFDAFKHQSSPIKPEENGEIVLAEGEPGVESCDQSKPGSLGKKMKAISMTMRKKMGRKYVKALSEEMGDSTERDHEGEGAGETDGSHPLGKGSRRTSNSLESLYSHNSGQSSSSGVTSGSDGSANRDSLRLEEEVPYTGAFCGRARVHTDFVPSPYDTDSLKLQVGDVIDIISKPPMGIWTGMLNNKVGNFKFIYVDIIVEKEPEPERTRGQRQSSLEPQAKSPQELLKRLNLEEYTSSLLLNGYETVEDLKDLKEKHLIELNMTDPEHRHRLLAAVEGLIDTETHDEEESKDTLKEEAQPGSLKEDQSECPRDSGCYITPECSDSSRDDPEVHPATPETPQAET
ncbi:SAM domain-containing protein SAMSN-1-like [Megalops cyprinoides]|uniref:SAM domain-containing protein SAMSN-1-like n=1 Tax=Megalops cyprinoides TaxID=118141 RepID=UPI001864C3A9|nr:SAM domain-containing protein SAMSN-1-like [Megalops cyprinoides]